jgi:hypothetical protein
VYWGLFAAPLTVSGAYQQAEKQRTLGSNMIQDEYSCGLGCSTHRDKRALAQSVHPVLVPQETKQFRI